MNATPTVPLDNVAGSSVIAGHTGGGIGAAAITSASTIVCAQPFASMPRMVNVDEPAVVGVPASTPADVSVSPAGSAPTVTPKLYGAVPPLPVIVCVNATPTVPLGNVAGSSVIAGHTGGGIGAAAITSASTIVCAQPFASMPRIVKVDAPAVVGVPASTPADVSVSPAGSAPTVTPKLERAVPPLPVIVCVNATPTVPLDNVAGNNVIVGHTGGGKLAVVAITNASASVCAQPFASVARIVNVEEPDVVGGTRQHAGRGQRESRRQRAHRHAEGCAVLPLPVIVWVNATPTVPLDNVAGNSVIAGHTGGGIGAAAITSARAIVCAQPLASVPRIVNVDAPDVVGVPASTPADVSVSPAGNAPTVTPSCTAPCRRCP